MAATAAPTVDELAALAAQLKDDGKPSAATVPLTDQQQAYFAAGLVPPPAASVDEQAQDTLRKALLVGADTNSGAPVSVRALVGASPENDRLATLQRSYPDAVALPGTDNFVYTDPDTKARQTYAPIGWRVPTVGDIASVGGEIGEGIGGISGAAAAAPSGPAGMAVGGGLGAAAGKEGWQALMRLLGGVDTRSPVQQGVDLATTVGLNAVLPEAGARLGGPVLHSLLAQPRNLTDTQAAARALDLSGLTTGLETGLPAGIASERQGVQAFEQPLMQMPFSSSVRRAYSGTRDQLEEGTQQAARNAAGSGAVPPPTTFASNVSNVAEQIDRTYATSRQAADDAATRLIGANRPVNLQPVRDLRDQLQTQLAQAPGSLAERYQPALDRINTVLADATRSGSDTLPYDVVRNIRTDVGKALDFAQRGTEVQTGVQAQRDVYGALRDSLQGAARDAGPQAEQALAAHDTMVQAYNAPDGPKATFDALQDPARRADRITQMMQSSKPADQAGLVHLIQYATPEQRQELASGTIQQMGVTKDGSFDMPTWYNNYKATSPVARDLMFGPDGVGTLQRDLSNLATVQRTMSQSATAKNFSNSAPAYAVISGLTSLGGVAGHVLAGEPGLAVGAAAGLAAPAAAGKLMTSQPFVRWLTGTYGVNGADAAQWAAHLARLGTVAQADPGVADLVAQLRAQLPDQLPPKGGPDMTPGPRQ